MTLLSRNLRRIGQSISNLRFSFFYQKTPEPLLENQTSLANLAKRMNATDVVWKELSPEAMKQIENALKESENSHPRSEY